MHHQIFGHSFAEFVALILLPGLAFYFLNKMKASVHGNAKDVDTGASGLMTTSTETNSGVSSSTDLMTTSTETNSCGSSSTESNNGASSSLTASPENCYEVFLSFRGSDTRKGFTDHLYHGLRNAGIDVFRDNNELSQGKNIRPELLAAITKSKILIPILSKKYGTSSWCLDELVQIMECKNNNGQIVLPIFYKVKPTEVRNQTGKFGDAFRERERCLRERSSFDPTILGKWKKALDEVSTLKGYEADGYEAELVKSVVRKALSELKKKFELGITENLVGIDSHVKEVMEFMDNKSHATLFVGIHGMGGIGKTTLAKAIYNKLSCQFEHRSFIADIRESWKRNGLLYLQNRLIKDILNGENEVRNEDEGTWFISSKFKAKKVLLLLDDVDNVVQLEHLARYRDWFSSGSRIIITTRNKSILEKFGVDYDHDHKEMDNDQSLILFSKHAFRMDSPPEEFNDLTREVVSITGGLPLSIEVFGSLLCGEEPTQWRNIISKLKNIPNMKVQERLRISYDSLEDEQKQIFLDIACFFIGIDKRIASYMWEACDFFPGEGIEALRFMSLIKVVNDHELRMHDQLRDLGREIVRKENRRQPQYRSRLWDSKEALKVLKDNKMAKKLKYLDLSYCWCLENTDFLSAFEKLEVLILSHCWRLKQIDASIEDMEGLHRLELCSSYALHLVVGADAGAERPVPRFCLGELPAEIGKLKSLRQLDLSDTPSLSALPNSIGSLENLEILDISESGIEELPNGIGSLRKLRELRAFYCKDLKWILVESMANLSSLRCLDFRYCYKLQSLPELPSGLTYLGVTCQSHKLPSLSHLAHLKELKLWGCGNLQCIQELPSTQLKSSKCSQPTDIEESESPQSLNTPFGCLKKLNVDESNEFFADNYNTLTEIEGLDRSEYLESLGIHWCTSTGRLDLPKFTMLKKLVARNCKNLAEIQGLDSLEYLESLAISRCTSIGRLDLPKSGSMKTVNVRWCKKLAEIHGLDWLESLEILEISWCTSIERLLLPKSGSLKRVNVGWCKKLAEIHGLDRSESLEILEISWCTSIERLLLPKSGSLKRLEARDCKNLVEIQGLDRLEFLEKLNIIGCKSLKTIPELSGTQIYRHYQITDGRWSEPCPYQTDDSDEE